MMGSRVALSICTALFLFAAPAVAEQQTIPVDCQSSSALACVEHKGLTITLTEEAREGRVVVVRFFGGTGEDFDQGPDRLLYEEVIGEAAGEFFRFGERQTMAVLDANADGRDELVVAALVPVPGAERKLKLFSLNRDQRKFTGALFFRHGAIGSETAFLGHPFGSQVSIGRTIQIGWPDGRQREYRASDPYTFTLLAPDPNPAN